MKNNLTSIKDLIGSDRETDKIPKNVFDFIIENLKKLGINLEPREDLSSFNELNELMAEIFSHVKRKETHYSIGHNLHQSHLLLVGYFQHYISELDKDRRPEIFNILKTKINSGQLDIEIPLNKCFLKLNWDSRQVFDQILLGFFDRVSEILFGLVCKQVRLAKKALHVTFSEPIGTSSEIVNSIPPNRYNFVQLTKLFLPKVDATLIEQIRNLLIRDIGFSLDEISTQLNKSKRTIQRELKSHGQNFLSIKEDTRKLLLEGYLIKGFIKIDELADLLAYSERSSFEKAYKKWYGKNISVDLKNVVRH